MKKKSVIVINKKVFIAVLLALFLIALGSGIFAPIVSHEYTQINLPAGGAVWTGLNADKIDGQDAISLGAKADFQGFTSTNYTGNMGGISGADSKCSSEFSGSHLCTVSEIAASANFTHPQNYSWVVYDISPATFDVGCNRFNESKLLSVLDSDNDVGRWSSIVAPASDTIYVSYLDTTNTNLMFLKSTTGGLNWSNETLFTAVGSTSIGTSGTDTIYIAYKNGTYTNVAKSVNAGQTWSQLLGTAIAGESQFLNIDVVDANTVFISVYQSFNLIEDLRVLNTTDGGATWTSTDVDTTNLVGKYSSIDAVNSSLIFVSYYYETGTDLKFANSSNAGSSWSTQTIESTNDVGKWTSLVAVNASVIYISYYNATGGDLKFANSSDGGSTWSTKNIDTAGNVGEYTSISATDVNNIFITYYDSTSGNLKLARSSDGGTTWNTETVASTGDVGQYTSIDVVNANKRYASFYDVTGGNLQFYRVPGIGQTLTFNGSIGQRFCENNYTLSCCG